MPDPDLEIRGGVGGWGGAVSKKIRGDLAPQPIPWIRYGNSSPTGAEPGFFKGGSHCVTPRVFTRLACEHPGHILLKVMFILGMSSECGGRNKPTRLIAA